MGTKLSAKNIFKVYKTKAGDTNAINGISLDFEEGLIYAIIGKSGSGKSTLIHILGGLDKPTEGDIIIDDTNILSYSDEKMAIFRRRYMGFVFQQFNLIEDYSVKNNICMPVKLDGKKADKKFLAEIAKVLEIEDLFNKYPDELSGGEQQRVAIARAIIAKPELIFADEPTGNLDKKTGDETIELLFSCAKKLGQTLIIVTHDLELAKKADRIIQIEDGKVI